MTERTNRADLMALTAQIVAAHVSNNAKQAEAVPPLIQSVLATLGKLGRAAEPQEKLQPGVAL